MSTNNKNNEEEVDLGSLFVIIGKGFSNLFNFIGSFFRGVFDFFIQVLLFFKSNIIKLGLAVLVCGLIGGYLDYNNDIVYESKMVVKPNFESTKQLYANILYFDNLISSKKQEQLSQLFNLSLEEAKSIKSFKIKPLIKEDDIVKAYDGILKRVDTLASKNYTYKKFKNSFTDVDYFTHIIKITSTQNDIFNKFNNTILKGIADNDFFKTIQKVTIENISRSENVYRKNLIEVDSLRKLYAKVLLEESKKTTSETTINAGGNTTNFKPKEIELFETSTKINNNLRIVNEEKAMKSKIVNVVSSFQAIGYKKGGILSNNYLKFAVLGGVLMTLFLLLIKLNTYLEAYKK